LRPCVRRSLTGTASARSDPCSRGGPPRLAAESLLDGGFGAEWEVLPVIARGLSAVYLNVAKRW